MRGNPLSFFFIERCSFLIWLFIFHTDSKILCKIKIKGVLLMKKAIKRVLVVAGIATAGVVVYNLVKKQKDVELCSENDCVECLCEEGCDNCVFI